MMEGHATQIASSGKGLYKALNCKEPPSTDTLSAMQILFEGSQYLSLLTALAERTGGPPHLHITGIDDPKFVKHIAGGLDVVGKRLEQFANHLVLLYNLYPL